MREDLLVYHASPVLAGITAANLFQIRSEDTSYVRCLIKTWQGCVKKCPSCDLHFRLIAKKNKGYLVLVYRKNQLEKILQDEEIQSFIEQLGYNSNNIDSCLKTLSQRLRIQDFPHEIGLFLGYPLDDVKAFIENKGQNFRLNGTWKVYSEKEKKQKIFNSYQQTKIRNINLLKEGCPISKLVS